MAFYHVKGPAEAEQFLKQASTEIAVGAALGFLPNGYVASATAPSTRIAGVSVQKNTSTDSNFANNTAITVVVPGENDIFLADVNGTATQANVGKQYDLSQGTTQTTAQTVNLSGTTYKVVTVVGFVSASQVLVKFNGAYEYANKAN